LAQGPEEKRGFFGREGGFASVVIGRRINLAAGEVKTAVPHAKKKPPVAKAGGKGLAVLGGGLGFI
jgi:hypothetical protein